MMPEPDGAVGTLDAQEDQIAGFGVDGPLVLVPQNPAEDQLSLRILRRQVGKGRRVLSGGRGRTEGGKKKTKKTT